MPHSRNHGANDELGVGLIGFGLAGSVFHAPLIAATPGLRLAVVVTSDAERTRQATGEHPAVSVVASAERLWERADELDVVVVASPNRSHAPLARAAMAAGLATVVDKPLATSAAEGRQLIEESRSRGVPLTVFHNRRWDGDFRTVQHLLEAGALGRVHRYESRFERWRPTPREGWRESGAPADAGGVLYDLGSHLVDQAIALFGPVHEVYAELDRRRPGVVVEDDVFLALRHASGVASHLWMSAAAAQPGPRLRVLGSVAGYTKHGLDPQEEALRSGDRPPREGWGTEPEGRWGRLGAGDDERPVPTLPGAYPEYYARLVGALRGEGPPPVDPADAVAGLEILEAARRSASGRSVVRLPAEAGPA